MQENGTVFNSAAQVLDGSEAQFWFLYAVTEAWRATDQHPLPSDKLAMPCMKLVKHLGQVSSDLCL